MPRNASGVYTLPNPPVVTDTTIVSNDENTTRDDMANELTNSLSRNGQGGMLAPFRIADGLLATPGLAFLNDPDSGLYRAGADDIRMAVGAADVMQWTGTAVNILKAVTFAAGIGAFSTTGAITVQPPVAAGAQLLAATLVNLSSVADTAVALRLQPSTANTRFAEIVAGNDGANNIGLALRPMSLGAPQQGIFIDATAHVKIGADITVAPFVAKLAVDTLNDVGGWYGFWGANASGSRIAFGKARGGAVGTHGALVANDDILGVQLYASDGAAFVQAASILCEVDAAPAGAIIPTRFVFFTMLPTGVLTEGLRIRDGGIITALNTDAPFLVGTQTPGSGKARLFDVNGASLELSGVTGANGADKITNILVSRFTNSQVPFTLARVFSSAAQSVIQLGGGGGSFANATEIQLRTGPLSAVGNTGLLRLSILEDGTIQCGSRFQVKRGGNVASASTIVLPDTGNYFRVSGAVTINLIDTTGWQGGSMVTLKFLASVTVTHNAAPAGAAHPLFLAGAVNFAATSNDTLTLVYDDVATRWDEVSRTVI